MRIVRSLFNIICLFCVLGISISANAQNNPYKINDSLYKIYQLAIKNSSSPYVLHLADSMHTQALALNDKKAQCIALCIPVSFHFNYDTDGAKFHEAVVILKNVSRANNYLQYYYYACSQEVNYLLVKHRSYAALQMAERLKEEAFQEKNNYGIYTCLRMLGNIYAERNNCRLAIVNYKNALQYMQNSVTDQDPAYVYTMMARCYLRLKGKEFLALQCIDEALAVVKTDQSKITALLVKCFALWHVGDKKGFSKCYAECTALIEKHGVFQKRGYETVQVYNLINEGKYIEALLKCDEINPLVDALRLRESIYLAMGDFQGAYQVRIRFTNIEDSLSRDMQMADLSELNAMIGNEHIKLEAQTLALENAQLNADKANMELEKSKSEMVIERINAENNKLTLHNKELELARLRMDSERMKAIAKEQEMEAEHDLIMHRVILSFMIVVLIMFSFYAYRRRKSIINLRKKNEELDIARHQAEQADKMKTFFIQNMSHEIRTPLNAIVGFSQLLFDSDIPLEDEEKREFSRLISQNTELLTTLVNDILDLSNLESGKYVMNMAQVSCNEMCRSALSTVQHRKPENVRLYYTSEVNDDYKIYTDESRCRQVLINFLTNAEKYTEQGEIHLRCSLSENPGKITFSVTDTGTGIPLDKAETIFNRFEKLDTFKQGTGLGLNICTIIANRLNGLVKLDKEYRKGARFLFILPLEKENL